MDGSPATRSIYLSELLSSEVYSNENLNINQKLMDEMEEHCEDQLNLNMFAKNKTENIGSKTKSHLGPGLNHSWVHDQIVLRNRGESQRVRAYMFPCVRV